VKRNPRRPGLKVSADGDNVVGHAGARLLSDLADELGLTEELSAVMASTKQRRRGHDRGQVLVDVAAMIADGGEAISDLAAALDLSDETPPARCPPPPSPRLLLGAWTVS
jgi:hypothetical protein